MDKETRLFYRCPIKTVRIPRRDRRRLYLWLERLCCQEEGSSLLTIVHSLDFGELARFLVQLLAQVHTFSFFLLQFFLQILDEWKGGGKFFSIACLHSSFDLK